MYPRILNREKSPYLVLSITLHLLLFLLMYERITHLPSFVQKNEIEKEFPLIIPIPHKEIAALKPRASQFGIPVIFQEEPTLQDSNEKNDGDIETDNAPSQPTLQDSEDLQNLEKSTLQESANIQKQELVQAQQPLQTKLEKFDDSIAKSDNSIIKIENIPNSSQNTSELSQTTQPPQFHKPITQTQKETPSKTALQPSRPTKNAGPIARQLTFADLAQGFIQTIKNEGQDFFEREGNENIRPDLEEMKLISYKQKIVWFIQNAFHFCHDAEPSHPEAVVKCCTILILNDDGSIRNLQLVYSTGVQEFDKYYLTGIKSAAPFPPIPQHIKKPFVFPFTMIYYTRPKNMTAFRQPPLLRFSSK